MDIYQRKVGYIVMDEADGHMLRVEHSWLSRNCNVKTKGEQVQVFTDPTVACRKALAYRHVRTKPVVLYHNETLPKNVYNVIEWIGDAPVPDQELWHKVFVQPYKALRKARELYEKQNLYWSGNVEPGEYYVTVQTVEGEVVAAITHHGEVLDGHEFWAKYSEGSI